MKNTTSTQNLWSTGAIALMAIMAIANNSCTGDTSNSGASGSASTTDTTEVEPTPKKETGWEYKEDIDQMDNTKTTMAALVSDNTVEFEFPYGESSFTLLLRKKKGSTDVILTCSKCQFITGIMDDKKYRVKFDDEPPFNVFANSSSSGSADVVFLGSEAKLISKLKKAEKMIIEAEFYDRGLEQITFSTKGLKWE